MGRNKHSFEELIKEINAIVTRMEKGDQPLEDSIEDFERGVKIIRESRAMLDKAELKVLELSKENASDGDEADKNQETA